MLHVGQTETKHATVPRKLTAQLGKSDNTNKGSKWANICLFEHFTDPLWETQVP